MGQHMRLSTRTGGQLLCFSIGRCAIHFLSAFQIVDGRWAARNLNVVVLVGTDSRTTHFYKGELQSAGNESP